jgi:hypothetical protein
LPNFGSEGIYDSHLEPENLQPLNRMEKVVEKAVPCVKRKTNPISFIDGHSGGEGVKVVNIGPTG